MTAKKPGAVRGRPPNMATVVAKAVADALKPKAPTAATTRRFQNRYDAAGQGRRMAGWNPKRTSPTSATVGLETIRERSRDSTRNDWASASINQKWTTSLIGIGITPRWKRIKDKDRKQQIVDLFADASKVMDANNVFDYFGLQTQAVRTWFDGGECFARMRRRFPDTFKVPFQVQLLEADMCPMLDSTSQKGLPAGNEIKQGIEFDKRGRCIAYWFFKDHPGDKFQTYNGEELVRVAASEVIHMFEPKRPGQLRGVSESATILARLRNAADYEDATLERQKLANLFVAFLKRTMPDFDPLANDTDPLSGKPVDEAAALPMADGTPVVGMEPGLFQVLGDGEEVQFSNPPEPGTTYSDYMRTTHLGTSAGSGLPYELMSGDILNISDRTLRVIINEFRRLAEQRQWQIVIPMFCQRIIDWFADSCFIAGLIAADEIDVVKRVEHAPHGWAYIHPTQDIEGKKVEMEIGVTSQSAIISQRGDDPDQVAEEIAEDDKRMQRLKIGPYSKAAELEKPVPAAAPAPAPKKNEEDAEPKPAARMSPEEIAVAARIVALLEAA